MSQYLKFSQRWWRCRCLELDTVQTGIQIIRMRLLLPSSWQ